MIITNITGLPQPIVDAIKADTYSRGEADISVTQLIDPPQKVWLEEQHADEITEDAADLIYRLDGKIVHEILQKSPGIMLAEKRLFAKCGGWTISGAMDRIALMEVAKRTGADRMGFGCEIQDWKHTTKFQISLHDGCNPQWVNQLNCYAWLLRENGYSPEKLTVVAILRDWSKLEAKRNRDYPQSQVMVIDVPMWGQMKAEEYVRARVAFHRQHRNALDQETSTIVAPDLYRHCTPEERWERPTKWAVMKEGRKSALRVLDNEPDAYVWAFENGHGRTDDPNLTLKPGISIVERPGEAVRCESYCNAAPWCPQYQQEKADGAE